MMPYPPILTLPFFVATLSNVGAGTAPDSAILPSSVSFVMGFWGSEDLIRVGKFSRRVRVRVRVRVKRTNLEVGLDMVLGDFTEGSGVLVDLE
ncbi:hypothetical protein ACFX2A_007222 [Malus domestica]